MSRDTKKNLLVLSGLVIFFILGFLICHPKINGFLFPTLRQKRWENFQSLQKENLDLVAYFKVRELLGGFGSWEFDYEQIEIGSIFRSLPANYQARPILELATFTGPYLTTQTLLVQPDQVSQLDPRNPTLTNNTSFYPWQEGSDYIFYSADHGQQHLYYQSTGENFLENQGFFDFLDPNEADYIKNLIWIEKVTLTDPTQYKIP